MDDDIANYDYELPPQLIAQRPPKVRDGGKLLALCGQKPVLHHIVDLPSLLQAGDLLVVNNSRVLPGAALRTNGKRWASGSVGRAFFG